MLRARFVRRRSLLIAIAACAAGGRIAPPTSAPPVLGRPAADAQSGAADLQWSTFLGGTSTEDVYALAVDAGGTTFVGGETRSVGLATAGAPGQTLRGGHDGFVAALAPAGDVLAFFSYLGGSGRDYVTDLVVDPRDGSLLVAGYTDSPDFPATAGAYDERHGGAFDAFVARFDPAGPRLVAATYLGGVGNDYAETVRLDATGNVYASGETWSADFPTTPGAFDRSHGGLSDMFVVRLDADLRAAGYATLIGGSRDDCMDCSMDVAADGRATIVLKTSSPDLPATAAALATRLQGATDAFVGRLTPDGWALDMGTYLGGTGQECEEGCYVAADADGSTVVVGNTSSRDFPLPPGAPMPPGGMRDGFVVRLSVDGGRLTRGRFLGGRMDDVPRDVALAPGGAILVIARTGSSDYPVTADSFDPTYNGSGDLVISRLESATLDLAYGSFVGGTQRDGGWRPRVVPFGADGLLAVGTTASSDFPTTAGAYDRTYEGLDDAAVFRLGPAVPVTPSATSTPTPAATPRPPDGPRGMACPDVRAPADAIRAALADPDAVDGWGMLCNPNVPFHPLYNAYRTSLMLRHPGLPYHAQHNGLVFRCGCR